MLNLDDEETRLYIKQLEDENLRLKLSNKSLRKNNQGLNKISGQLYRYKKKYGKLE